jgi:hypothetical protein
MPRRCNGATPKPADDPQPVASPKLSAGGIPEVGQVSLSIVCTFDARKVTKHGSQTEVMVIDRLSNGGSLPAAAKGLFCGGPASAPLISIGASHCQDFIEIRGCSLSRLS